MNAYDTVNYESILSGSTLEFYDQSVETSTAVLRIEPNFDQNTLHIESFKDDEFVSSIFIGGDIRANIIEVNQLYTLSSNVIEIYHELVQKYNISYNSKGNNSFIIKDDILQNFYDKIYIDDLIINYYTKDQINSLFTNYFTKTQIDFKFSNYYEIDYINTEFSKYLTKDVIVSTYANIEWIHAHYYTKSNIDDSHYNKIHIDEFISNIENNYYTNQYINSTFANIEWISQDYYNKSIVYTQQEIDTKFYDKQNIDDKFANIDVLSDNHYTKSNIDTNFYTKSEITSIIANTSWDSENPFLQTYIEQNYYTRPIIDSMISNIDALFYNKAQVDQIVSNIDFVSDDHYDKANIDTLFYNKEQVDQIVSSIDFVSDDHYDKANIDALFYNKAQVDSTFATTSWVSQQITDFSSQNVDDYVTKTEADETYFKKDDLLINNTYKQKVEANIDIYQTIFKNIVFVDVFTVSTDYVIVYITTPYIRFTFQNYGNINERSFEKGNVFFCNHNVYLLDDEQYIIQNQYFGVYDIVSVEYTDNNLVILCSFHTTMSSVSDFVGTAIFIKNTNTTYIVSSDDENYYTILPLHDVNYGSIAKQSADDVHITGGIIQCPQIHVNEIKPIEGQDSISIRLPTSDDQSSFFVKNNSIESYSELNNDVVFSVDGAGLVSAYQFNSLSDRRLKRNEETIQNPLNLIRKLNGKTFDWKDETKNKNPGHKQYGFIAQEVASEFPTLVNETVHEYLSVDYAKVVSILVESVKVLHDAVIEAGLTTETTSNVDCHCHCTPIITPSPVLGTINTNIVSFGEIDKQIITVRMTSTSNDIINISPLFNQGDYTLYSNQGKNTLDGYLIELNDTILVKDCVNNAFNGVYTIIDIQEGEHGNFSKCIRHEHFTNYSNINGSTIIVQPSGMYGNGKGVMNPGQSFLCTVESNINMFNIDSTAIEFIQFTSQTKGTLAEQDINDVHITGGTISIDTLHTNEIHTHNSNVVSVHLDSPTTTFSITNSNHHNVCTIDAYGKVTASDYFSPSDERLKTNVTNIQNALSLVRKLTGVTFDWKDETKNIHEGYKQYGFIAQDVAVHFPTIVHESNERLSVDYAKTVAILVEAVKELGDVLNI